MAVFAISRHLLTAISFLMAVASPALAAPEWPPGWATSVEGGAQTAESPAAKDGLAVVLVAFAPEPVSSQPAKAWLDTRIGALATPTTKIARRSGVTSEGTMLKDGFEIRETGQPAVRVFAFGYETANGRQLALILSPTAMKADDTRIGDALDAIATNWKSGTLMAAAPANSGKAAAPTKTAKAPAKPATSPAGSNCREELVPITTWTMQQVCYAPIAGMSNCHLQSVPVQQTVKQMVCR